MWESKPRSWKGFFGKAVKIQTDDFRENID